MAAAAVLADCWDELEVSCGGTALVDTPISRICGDNPTAVAAVFEFLLGHIVVIAALAISPNGRPRITDVDGFGAVFVGGNAVNDHKMPATARVVEVNEGGMAAGSGFLKFIDGKILGFGGIFNSVQAQEIR